MVLSWPHWPTPVPFLNTTLTITGITSFSRFWFTVSILSSMSFYAWFPSPHLASLHPCLTHGLWSQRAWSLPLHSLAQVHLWTDLSCPPPTLTPTLLSQENYQSLAILTLKENNTRKKKLTLDTLNDDRMFVIEKKEKLKDLRKSLLFSILNNKHFR